MSARRGGSRTVAVVGGLAAAAVLAGCGGGASGSGAAATASSATPSPTSAAVTAVPTTVPTPSTATRSATRSPTRTVATKTTTSRAATRPATSRAASPTCTVPSGVRATQVLVVVGSGSRATVRACRRSGSGYVTQLGPFSGHVGKNGVTSNKREGDLRTPAGVFPLRGGFGVRANPGLRIGTWLRVDSRDVWVDDPASALYNTHQRTPADGRWASAEPLLNSPAYDYAQVIGYNEARTPGRGSAIFLHVDLGHGTAGCVSVSRSALLSVLRWERAGAVMAIR